MNTRDFLRLNRQRRPVPVIIRLLARSQLAEERFGGEVSALFCQFSQNAHGEIG